MPLSDDHRAARFGGPPAAANARRRAMPAAAGGRARSAASASASLRARGSARRLLLLWLTAIGTLLALVIVPSAHAEEVFTGQAAAANATDSTWIPAPAQKAAVCIIDTGNDPLPDTANVIARLSVDASDGTDLNPAKHGTLMAEIASAPYDGFGMVGVAPSINVVSVRASRDGSYFGGNELSTAMQMCISWRNIYNIKVVSMSLGADASVGGINADRQQRLDFQDIIDNARRAGLNVVAAAGNSSQDAIDWPAAYAPAFAVGAADNAGVRCAFASRGSGLDLWAPGCPLDVGRPDATGRAAWANGSSEATALVAGALTQLRGLRPDLGPDQAEQLLIANAAATIAGPYLSVGASFAAAGLRSQLAAGHAATPGSAPTLVPSTSSLDDAPGSRSSEPAGTAASGSASGTDMGSSSTPTPGSISVKPSDSSARTRLSKPVLRSLHLRRGLLTIVFKHKPTNIEARVQVYARKKGRAFPTLARSLHVTGDRVRTSVSGTLSEVSITYRDPRGIRRTSATLSVHPRK